MMMFGAIGSLALGELTPAPWEGTAAVTGTWTEGANLSTAWTSQAALGAITWTEDSLGADSPWIQEASLNAAVELLVEPGHD